MPKLTTGQIDQLIDLDRAGEGIGSEVEELIRRLASGSVGGGKSDLREAMARCLWDRGFGRDPVIAENFEAYLAGIPQIPEGLVKDDSDLPFLSLADPRPGLLRSCQLLGVQYEELGYSESSAEPFDDRFPLPTTPFWFRHDDGRANRNRRPDHCRDELQGDILAGSAMEGIFAYVPTTTSSGKASTSSTSPGRCTSPSACSASTSGCGAVRSGSTSAGALSSPSRSTGPSAFAGSESFQPSLMNLLPSRLVWRTRRDFLLNKGSLLTMTKCGTKTKRRIFKRDLCKTHLSMMNGAKAPLNSQPL